MLYTSSYSIWCAVYDAWNVILLQQREESCFCVQPWLNDKWMMPYTVSRTVYCREDRCFHFVSKMKGFAYILTLEKCRDFFENSNGKCAKGSLYRWKTKHLMGEHPFTC